MRVLITGANGMVARAAVRLCTDSGDDVTALTRQDLDISDHAAVRSVLKEVRPDAVLNCAAYTNVDGAEIDKSLAYAANAVGVENLAVTSKEIDARFVTISTDYVFDGTKSGFYTQRDTPDPRGVYAMTKYYGELLARNAYARTIIVRSGWIFGPGGTNFLSVIDRLLKEGNEVRAIADAYGTPTYAPHLALRLRQLAELDLPGVYHVTNAGRGTSYFGFAEKVCELANYPKEIIKPVSMDELKRPAPRPKSSKLACLFSDRLGLEDLPSWDDALRLYLN